MLPEWEAMVKANVPDRPRTPFQMPDYKTKHYAAALQAEKRGIAESKKARTANRHSNDYLLLTVMFASVLFPGSRPSSPPRG